jgi:hypothetical protein
VFDITTGTAGSSIALFVADGQSVSITNTWFELLDKNFSLNATAS